jgi:hypothetical protein
MKMGEYADMIIEGETCACGEFIGEAVGYPQFCSKQCALDYGGAEQVAAQTETNPPKTVACPLGTCERKFRTRQAAAQHWVMKHNGDEDVAKN